MTKLTTNDISSILSNPVGAATAINVNNALIEAAMEKTLSRDGSTPNTMEASIDMNSNRVLNLPAPASGTEPLRLGDVNGDINVINVELSELDVLTSPTLTTDYALIYDAAPTGEYKKYLPFSRDTGLTIFDSAAWTGAKAMRIGANLDDTGAGFPGDNEFGLVVAAHTTGPTNSISRTYKVGILSIAATADPSDFGNSLYRMSVGADTRGYALDDNLTAFIFGAFSGAYFYPGSDGGGRAHESEVNNFSATNTADVTSPYAKFAYHAVAGGDEPVTCGLMISPGEFIANQFFHGIYGVPSTFSDNFIILEGLHSVKPTGAGGFGTDTPDRMVHSNVADAATNTVSGAIRLSHVTSGTAAAGFGVSTEFELENAAGTEKIAGVDNIVWDVATDTAEYASRSFTLMSNGTLATALTISALGILTIPGYLQVGSSQVVGSRKTGWTTATGTAQRSGYATYTSPNISAGYVEAEVQAIADALQNVSRTLKAVIDDLHNTAGHGLIGT